MKIKLNPKLSSKILIFPKSLILIILKSQELKNLKKNPPKLILLPDLKRTEKNLPVHHSLVQQKPEEHQSQSINLLQEMDYRLQVMTEATTCYCH
jgi:hypothetical protein